jgi:hypothetical protein
MVAALAIVSFAAMQPLMVKSQTVETLQPRFGQTLVLVNQAESAGATSGEIGQLVALLNKALERNREAVKLTTPEEAQKRAGLLAQVDQILETVENRAAELNRVASQRSYTYRVLSYVWGATVAVFGTMVYAFAVSSYREYRIKRTFQMRVTRK